MNLNTHEGREFVRELVPKHCAKARNFFVFVLFVNAFQRPFAHASQAGRRRSIASLRTNGLALATQSSELGSSATL